MIKGIMKLEANNDDLKIPKDEKKKIALFCSVPQDNVISMHDVETVYSIPLLLNKQKVDEIILKKLKSDWYIHLVLLLSASISQLI
mgnify:CR=1 FL=1